MTDLQKNLDEVTARITQAAKKAQRDPGEVSLIVVTKGYPAQTIQDLYELGVHDLGESYVEEGLEKQKGLTSLERAQWHMIGHVQSRKAEAVARHFDLVHSVDSLKLAKRLDRFSRESGRVLPILLECNVSGETTKHGWPAWDQKQWETLLPEIAQLVELSNVRIHGLMSMAPLLEESDKARPYFARTRLLRDHLTSKFPQADWSQLSMGMSGDFEAAILEGATMVRIGTAIVGRDPIGGD